MPATRTAKHRHPEVRASLASVRSQRKLGCVRASKGAAPDRAKSRAPEIFASNEKGDVRIKLRLPTGTLGQIKIAANKRDVPYQSLIKVWLKERVDAD